MSETIRIEIPIEAKDNTGAGISSVQSRLTGLERALQRMEKMFSRMDKTGALNFDTGAAEQSISSFEDRLGSLNGETVTTSMQVDNAITDEVTEAQDALSALDGEEAEAAAGLDDRLTGPLGDAQDELAALDGEQATVEAVADDRASPQLGDVSDAVARLNGASASVEVTVSDMATDVLTSIIDLTNALNGATAAINVTVDDSALSTLLEIQDVVDSLNGASVDIGSFMEGGGNGGSSGGLNLGDGVGAVQGAAQSAMGNAFGYAATAAGFAGMSLGFGSALRTFESFEAVMSQVQAISGATASQMEKLTDKALEMGAKTKFTATQSGEAYSYMAMAGWDYEQMMAGIEPIMNLAAASGLDLGRTSDIVTDALTAFGLKADDAGHFADVLAQAAASSNTNVDMLGESFKYVAPAAGALGYSIEDVAIGLGLMANSGIKSSMAGTSLRRSIMNLSKPTEEMQEVMDRLHISLTDDEGNLKSLGEVMDNIRDGFSDLSDAEKVTAASTLFGATAMSGMLSIINASEGDYQRLINKIYDAEGAAKSMAEIMMDNMYGSLTLLSSAFDGVQMAIGGGFAPSITTFANGLTESMPLIAQAFTDIIGDTDELEIKLDGLTDTFRQNIQSLINSDEWANADTIGKIDLAWDKIIAEPLQEWAGTDGVHLVSSAISGMFQSAGDVLTGEGTLTDWIATGALVSGIGKVATAVGGVVTAVQGLASAGGIVSAFAAAFNPVTVGAAAAVVAVLAISAAIDDLNQKKIEMNLEEHFGDMSLNLEQIEGLSGEIVPVDVIAELTVAETHFKNAESLVSDAEEQLKGIGIINWEVQKLGIRMDSADFEGLAESASIIQEKLTDALKEQNQGVDAFLSAIMPQGEASEISSQIDDWFAQDIGTLNGLGTAVQNLIQKSIDEGVENVDTAAAISILQGKMMDIVSGARQSQLQGSMDWLNARSSLAALDPDSWSALVSDIGRAQNDWVSAMQPTFERVYSSLDQLEANDPSRSPAIQTIKSTVDDMVRQLDTQALGAGTETMVQSINEAYADELSSARDTLSSLSSDFNSESFLSRGMMDLSGFTDAVQKGMTGGLFGGGAIDRSTQGALADRFGEMLPTINALERYIDNATEPIPSAIMDAYTDALELGAISGDTESTQKLYAQKIAESLPDGTTFEQFQGMMEESGIQLGEEWTDIFGRAFAETTEGSITSESMEALQNALESGNLEGAFDAIREQGFEIELDGENITLKPTGEANLDTSNMHFDWDSVDLDSQLEMLGQMLDFSGNTFTVGENGSLTVELSQATIDSGSAWDVIAEALGTSLEGLGELPTVDLGKNSNITFTLSEEGITIEAGGISEMVDNAIMEAGEMEPAEVQIDAAGEPGEFTRIDEAKSQFDQDAQSAFNEPANTSGTKIMASAVYGGDNGTIAAAYSAFAKAAQAVFSVPVPVTATISVSASSSGGVSAGGHAEGGFIGGPELSWVGEDGPEYIIPVGAKRQQRGLELWEEAGMALGAFDDIGGYADGGFVGSSIMPPLVSGTQDYSQYIPAYAGKDSGGESSGSSAPVNVNVSLSPSFTVNEGGNGTVEEIRRMLLGLTDDLAGEIAKNMSTVYSNSPVRQ